MPAPPLKQCKVPAHRAASAPYNFVPLPEKVVEAVSDANDLPGHDCFLKKNAAGKDVHTGYFEVQLTTQSPLYVRAGLKRKEFEQVDEQIGKPKPDNYDFTKDPKNKADFFGRKPRSVDDANDIAPDFRPVIPGSSLRGMMRQMLEVVSYSKMDENRLANKRLVYRAVGDQTAIGNAYRDQMLGPEKSGGIDLHFDYPNPNLKGGYLKKLNDGWGIQPAKEWGEPGGSLESFVHVHYDLATRYIRSRGNQNVHRNLFVEPASRKAPFRRKIAGRDFILEVAVTGKIENSKMAGLKPVTLVESGDLRGKHWHCAIYEADNSKPPIQIPKTMWDSYVEDCQLKRGSNTPTRPIKNDGDPLFYLLDSRGNLVYFGSTQFFRLLHSYSTHEFIPREIRNPQTIDFVDAIFGYITPKASNTKQGDISHACASRINVTDATYSCTGEVKWLNQNRPTVPAILATPKPTSFQHYLVQTNPKKDNLRHYSSKPVTETVIRGFKYYWRQGNVSEDDLKPLHGSANIDERGNVDKKSTQHTQMRPVANGAKFTFQIYFENLSDEELGALCWVLQPVTDPEIKNDSGTPPEYCHSLGMGKPFGMGAVKLSAELHLNKRQERYSKLFAASDDAWETGYEPETDDFLNHTKDFEKSIMKGLRIYQEGSREHLYQLERIAALLKMMAFPGCKAEREPRGDNRYLNHESRPNTRYMTIELPGLSGAEKNEYGRRPVLPSPLDYGRRRPESLCPRQPVQVWDSPPASQAPHAGKNVLTQNEILEEQISTQPKPKPFETAIVIKKPKKYKVRVKNADNETESYTCRDVRSPLKIDDRIFVEVKRDKNGEVAIATFKGRVD